MKQLIFLLLLSQIAFGQNVKTTYGSYWKVPGLEKLPADYSTSGKSYPAILFIGGTGQATDINTLDDYGPSALVAQGIPVEATINGVKETPIVISFAPGLWQTPQFVDGIVEDILKRYRINKLIVTGLSMGAGIWNQYIGIPEFAKKISAVYSLQGVSAPADPIGLNYNGKWWGVEGGAASEYRGGDLIAAAINKRRPGTAELTIIPQGKPGYNHCCWETMYALTFKNKAGQNWLEFTLSGGGAIDPPPIVTPPRVIAGRVFLAGWEFILYNDGTSESKK